MQRLALTSKNPYIARFNVVENYTFEDVKREADKAIATYSEKGRSWRHPFRAAGRAIGDTTAIEAWLGLLPNDSYCSIACGGLSLLYGVSLWPAHDEWSHSSDSWIRATDLYLCKLFGVPPLFR
jgi:hypothetical protein